jgi:hypothetical protein
LTPHGKAALVGFADDAYPRVPPIKAERALSKLRHSDFNHSEKIRVRRSSGRRDSST